ncbi:diguanylate cyclase [Photobacterium aphoticum]|uniref:sensor domain-containing diguanylate cyclase n=1 Tax=Photobacterium aphoticum TaxID=754436 RepID=UPI001304D07D|nr:diguanylate cyclase [Photobacterium aphoticum]
MSHTFESNKAQVYLFSKFISQVADNTPKQHVQFTGNIYSSDIEKAMNNDVIKSIYDESQKIYKHKPSWLSLFDLIYIKLHPYNTIISSRPMHFLEQGSYDIKYLFTEEYCIKFRACTNYIHSADLKDDLIFSEPHIDKDTNILTITLISPIYLHDKNIGDVQTDIHLSEIHMTSLAHFSYRMENGMLYLNLHNFTESTAFSQQMTFPIDSNATMVIYISYLPIVLFCLASAFMFGSFFYLVALYNRKKTVQSKLERDSMTDELTGCYNRKILTSKQLKKRLATSKSHVLIALDGNKLKQINDSYGHTMGDLAITHIAKTLQDNFTDDDIVIRHGGDEFIVVAINDSLLNIQRKLDKVHSALATTPVQDAIFVSLSAGMAAFDTYDALNSAIHDADMDLYRHKKRQHSE